MKIVNVEFQLLDGISYEKGYLVSDDHILMVDQCNKIWLHSVFPTEDPNIFKRADVSLQLGWLDDSEDELEMITKLYTFLNQSSAWTILTRCFPYPNPDIEFDFTERMDNV